MAIVKYKNQSGATYAYEATSNWDPVTKQSRPIRKYLGRVDDETGEIIPPTGKRGRPRKNPIPDGEEESEETELSKYKALYNQELSARKHAEQENKLLQARYDKLQNDYEQISDFVTSVYQQAKAYTKQK